MTDPTGLSGVPCERRTRTAVHCACCAGEFTADRADRAVDQAAIFCPFCNAPVETPRRDEPAA